MQHVRRLLSRGLVAVCLIVVMVLCVSGALAAADVTKDRIPNQVVVSLRANSGTLTISTLAQKLGLKVDRTIPALKGGVLLLPTGSDVDGMIQTIRRLPEVRSVAANYRRHVLALAPPNDPAYNDLDASVVPDPADATWYQWDMHLIQALEAWSIWPNTYYTAVSKPRDAIKLAIIDTGLDRNHPDFINVGGTSADSALGGQIDYADSANTISHYWGPYPSFDDEYGHGTHCAGTAAAATNNGASFAMGGGGIVGVGYNAQIIGVKVLGADGYGTDADIAAGITLAADRGAKVISLSLGGYGYSQIVQDAVNYAWDKGALIVASAGNDSWPYDPSYPAGCSRVLAVSATSYDDLLASYSNWGDWIGIGAPGGDVLQCDCPPITRGVWSTTPTYHVTLNDYGYGTKYAYLEGTSMACPHVSGLAALYMGYRRSVTGTVPSPRETFQAIQIGADAIDPSASPTNDWGSYFGYGRINAQNTLTGTNPRGSTVGSVTGQVLFQGEPAEAALVTATPTGGGTGHSTYTRYEDGCFRIANIAAGSYNVTASFSGKSLTVSGVQVVAGADTPAVDFSIDPPSWGAIAGQITDDRTGWPPPYGATVWVRRSGPAPTPWVQIVKTSSMGDYSAKNLTSGTYDVYVTAFGYRSVMTKGVAVESAKTTWRNIRLRAM